MANYFARQNIAAGKNKSKGGKAEPKKRGGGGSRKKTQNEDLAAVPTLMQEGEPKGGKES